MLGLDCDITAVADEGMEPPVAVDPELGSHASNCYGHNLGELLCRFFNRFGMTFDYARQAISVRMVRLVFRHA